MRILALSRTVSRYWDSGPQLESMPYRWSNSSPHSKSTEYVIYRMEQHWATTCKHTHTTHQPMTKPTNMLSVNVSLNLAVKNDSLIFSVWTSHFSILNFCLHHMLENHCERPSKYALVRKQGSTDDVRQWPSYRLWQNKLNAGFWLGLSKMDKCFNEAPTSDQFLNEKRFWFAND